MKHMSSTSSSRRPPPPAPSSRPRSPPHSGTSGTPSAGTQRKRKYHTKTKEIQKYQKSANLLLPKKPFCRLVREICQNKCRNTYRWKASALLALQEIAEAFLILVCSDAALFATKAKRGTLFACDIKLASRELMASSRDQEIRQEEMSEKMPEDVALTLK